MVGLKGRIRVGATAVAVAGLLNWGAEQSPASPGDSRNAGEVRFGFPEFAPGAGPFDRINARPVGDMTGDGIGEVAIAPGPRFVPDDLDAVWVKRGEASSPGSSEASTAFRVLAPVDLTRTEIAGISDLNGDDRAELAVSDGDDVFVVFGRDDGATVDVESLGSAGFRIANAGVSRTGGLLGPGDVDGDGRGDIAFSPYERAQVFFSPDDPAGQTFDAAAGGPLFETFDTADSDSTPTLAAPGDLDSDGADELVVFTGNAGRGTPGAATTVMDFRPGESSDLSDMATAGRGSIYRWPTSFGARIVGDVNGDGRRDLSVSSGGSTFLVYVGGSGTDRDVSDPQPGEGKLLEDVGRRLTDIGDMDGDGKDDLTDPQFMWLTGAQDLADPGEWWPQYFLSRFRFTGLDLVDTIPDETGDGLPELLTSRGDRDAERVVTGWVVQTFHSLALAPIELAKPGVDDTGDYVVVTLRGLVRITPALQARLTDPYARPEVTVENGTQFSGGSFDRTTGRIEIQMPAELIASSEDQGERVRIQVAIENDNVPVAISQPQSLLIDFDPGDGFYNLIFGGAENDTLPGTPEPDGIEGRRGDDRLFGRGMGDRLLGGPGRDSLRGASGDDLLVGGPGRDVLIGGPGQDVLIGGPGKDVLRCGRGRDEAQKVGPGDKTRGCERVRRKGNGKR